MWLVLILGTVIAVPLIIEGNRREMDDAARGAGPGQFAELPQGVTHYEWHGQPDGPLVICVHGLSTPSFVWRGLTKGLTLMGYRVLTYDLYGRGYSDKPKGAQDAAFFVRQLTDLMTHQEIRKKVTLIGFSMGGAITACFAAAFPDRVRQLVLLAPAGIQHAIGREIRLMRDTPILGDWLTLAWYPRHIRKGINAERNIASSVLNIGDLQEAELDFKGFAPAILAALRGILRHPLKAEHQKIGDKGVPVLAIWGENDATIPISAMGKLAEWNRNARQEQISGAGHALPYTHTGEVLALLDLHLIRD